MKPVELPIPTSRKAREAWAELQDAAHLAVCEAATNGQANMEALRSAFLAFAEVYGEGVKP